MPLNIDLKPTFLRTATFVIPSGRAFVEQQAEVTFEPLTIEEFRGYDLDNPEHVARFLKRVVVNMGDVVDDSGVAVPFSAAVLDALIGVDWGRQGLAKAYIVGRQKAAAGN